MVHILRCLPAAPTTHINSPKSHGDDVEGNCRGIVTANVLAKGITRRAIATRKIKEVNQDNGHERFILVRPLAVKVKPSPVDVVLLGFDDQGANTLAWLLICCFFPKPPPGHPLIYTR